MMGICVFWVVVIGVRFVIGVVVVVVCVVGVVIVIYVFWLIVWYELV